MELVYAALLLHEAGEEVNEDNLEGVMDGAGIEVDSSQVKATVAALEDVNLEEAMEQPAAAPAAAPATSGGEEASEEAAEEESAEEEAADEQADEEAEEAAEEGLGQLF